MSVMGLILSGLMIVSANTMMSFPPGIQQTYDPDTGEIFEPSYEYTFANGSTQIFTSSELRELIENNPEEYNAMLEATILKEGVLGIVFKSIGAFTSWLHAIVAAILVSIFGVFGGF